MQACVFDAYGALFDFAWGKRRYADGTDDPAGAITSQTNRGFTGHEELDAVGLVHMNGRVYDPLLARFGTPDPTTESPFSTQGWNRYSYVGNSPLNFTDPSGYCFLGCFWKPIFKAVGSFLKQSWGSILQIAAGALCTPIGLGPVCAAAASAFVAGVTSGSLGAALRAGFITAVTAAAFYGVGEITGHNPAFASPAHAANIAGHAAVGCLSSAASGGECGSGALAAGLGSAAAPAIGKAFPNPKTDGGDLFGGTVASSIVGGFGSVAGGGKFANGAVTAAFGYLFNGLAGKLVGSKVGGYLALLLAPESGILGYNMGSTVGGLFGDYLEDEIRRTGNYSHLEDPDSVGIGKKFTDEQREAILQENMKRNGGVLRSDSSGKELTRGIGPDSAAVDHIWPKSLGGTNSYGNAQVLSRTENRAKWNWFW